MIIVCEIWQRVFELIYTVTFTITRYAEGKSKKDAAEAAVESMNKSKPDPALSIVNVTGVLEVAENWDEVPNV